MGQIPVISATLPVKSANFVLSIVSAAIAVAMQRCGLGEAADRFITFVYIIQHAPKSRNCPFTDFGYLQSPKLLCISHYGMEKA